MRWLTTMTLTTSLALGAPFARASGVDPGAATAVQREQAQARFLRGKQLYEARTFDGAAVEFRASLEIVASPNTRLYLARSLREMGKIVEAYAELGRTEVEAREHAQDDTRYAKAAEAAAAERQAMRARVGFVTVRIDRPEESTRLVVGSEEIRRGGWNEPIPVVPGNAEIRLETAGREPVIGTVEIAAGQTKALSLDAASGARIAGAAPAPVAPVSTPETSAPTSLRPFAYVAGGVGVVGLAGFAVFGIMAKGTHDDLAARCPGGQCQTSPSDAVSKGKTQQLVADVSLAVGVVGLGAGVALFLLEPKKPSDRAARMVLGAGRLDVVGRF